MLRILIVTLVLAAPVLALPTAAAESACVGPFLGAVRVARHCVEAAADPAPRAAFCVGGGGDPWAPTPRCDRASVGGAREVDVDASSGYWSTRRTLVVDADASGSAHAESRGDIPVALLTVYPGLRGERNASAGADAAGARASTTGYNSNAPLDLEAAAGPGGVTTRSYGCFKGSIFGMPYGLECGDWTKDPRPAR